ncbi:hypothetical protein PMAYCL1PPCAC_03550, partial [Pristionchus mayeri]
VQSTQSSCPSGYDIMWKGMCVRSIELSASGTVRNLTDYALFECAKGGGIPPKVDTGEVVNFMHSRWASGVGVKWDALGVVCDTKTSKFHWADGTPIIIPVPSVSCGSSTLYFNAETSKIESNSNDWDAWGLNLWCFKTIDLEIEENCYDYDVIQSSDGDVETCAKLSSNSLTMEMAEEECEADFSGLASIHSKQANDFIRRQATSMGYLNGLLIGGNVFDNGTFSWIDGSPVDYTNFAPGFPLPGDGSCVAMLTSSVAGQWINTDCSISIPFACTRTPDAQAPACGSKVYKEGEIIYSPGYPKNASEPCDYELQVPERKIVQLEILNFEANSCCDHLTLHEGTVGGRLIANLTGGNLNGRKFRTFASNVMHLSWQPYGGENVR